MDPTKTLEEILEIARAVNEGEIWAYAQRTTMRMAELVEALNGWMANGGFPPNQWRK